MGGRRDTPGQVGQLGWCQVRVTTHLEQRHHVRQMVVLPVILMAENPGPAILAPMSRE